MLVLGRVSLAAIAPDHSLPNSPICVPLIDIMIFFPSMREIGYIDSRC